MNNSIFEPNDPIVQQMKQMWKTEFSTTPAVVGRAPGRLCLIGEHIDYSGFASVMMATQGKFTTVMIAETDLGLIRMRNLDPQFRPFDISIEPIDQRNGEGWAVFVESSVKLFSQKSGHFFKGLDLLITNSVPISSGLSSSGAILCALVSALNELAGTNLSNQEMFRIAIDAEHQSGSLTGGMDQISIFMAKRGFASLVSANPPDVKFIRLPPAKFVVAHCGVLNSKIDNPSFSQAYNQRLKEVTRCAELMKTGCKNIAQVVAAVGPEEALRLAKELPEKENDLVIRDRAIHVVEESNRVKIFCKSELAKWGKILDESNESLRDLYNISCSEMDALIEAGMRSGAMGARITGSGFGGCALFLLNSTQDPEPFIHSLFREYFEPRKIKTPIIFVTHPGPGAAAMKI